MKKTALRSSHYPFLILTSIIVNPTLKCKAVGMSGEAAVASSPGREAG